ncbi:MAG: preprotein translocase subunit YajC [Clostridia bacterium]|nr:preprotein translocase subunit YajC [Clostridia bacterium]
MFTFLEATDPTGGFGTWGTIIMIVIMFAVFYFFAIRPQKKQEKETQQMRDSLSIGDEIVTIGGIVGIITNITDETITIISSRDRTRIQFLKSAVSRVQVAANSQDGSDDKSEESKK